MIIHGDALTELKKIDADTIDCVVTSPPYNIGIKYNTYNDNNDNYFEFMRAVFIEIERTLTPNGHFFLNLSPTRKDPLFPYRVAEVVPMKIQNSIVWNKQLEIDGYVKGHGQVNYKTQRYLSTGWEMVWHFTKDGSQPIDVEATAVPYSPQFAEANTKRTGRTHRPTTNAWFIPYETVGGFSGQPTAVIKGEKKHPAIFPRELVRKCLLLSKATHVLDPFAGTGTVGVVASEMGIQSTLIEIDEDYCSFIRYRNECWSFE